MGNGYTDKDGYELARNSTRHASVNRSVQEMQAFGEVRGIWLGAAKSDREFYYSLGRDADIIIEEAAREQYEHVSDSPALPEDWKERINERRADAMIRFMQRPRG